MGDDGGIHHIFVLIECKYAQAIESLNMATSGFFQCKKQKLTKYLGHNVSGPYTLPA